MVRVATQRPVAWASSIASGSGPSALGRYTVSQLPGGKVRQFGERSTDGGKTWHPTFDYLYTRLGA
jgi:hypothetical protein